MGYFIIIEGTQRGPLSLEELQQYSISVSTPVWHEGLSDWTTAGNLPELRELLRSTPPPTGPTPRPSFIGSQGNPGSYSTVPTPSKPKNYLVESILVTFLCCQIFGIIAIVYAAGVDGAYRIGEYEEAERKSITARNWCIAGAVCGAVALFGYGTFFILSALLGTL